MQPLNDVLVARCVAVLAEFEDVLQFLHLQFEGDDGVFQGINVGIREMTEKSGRVVVILKVRGGFFEDGEEFWFAEETNFPAGLDAHVIPGRAGLGIRIPARADVGVGTGEKAERLGVLDEGFVMIGLSHHVPAEDEAVVRALVDQDRHLGGDGRVIAGTDQGSERMLANEIQHDLFISFLEVG